MWISFTHVKRASKNRNQVIVIVGEAIEESIKEAKERVVVKVLLITKTQ